ncbi:hypothetical protein DAEQUDRAFT_363037 [Daedalea quercina L-15889]|uniref:Uncharacterized protein n=1 Tax=Daedalea quercina L-15889 TaxID=1314783 RepID=A0A165TU28_9APHY|nr:hypothetical protein DAEQUDRAFT_363037 [Daedalea quercina L-15889]
MQPARVRQSSLRRDDEVAKKSGHRMAYPPLGVCLSDPISRTQPVFPRHVGCPSITTVQHAHLSTLQAEAAPLRYCSNILLSSFDLCVIQRNRLTIGRAFLANLEPPFLAHWYAVPPAVVLLLVGNCAAALCKVVPETSDPTMFEGVRRANTNVGR